MQIKIIKDEEVIKDPIKFIHKNFELREEGEKLFLRYDLDKSKQLRIFFKNTLLETESKNNIKEMWETGEGLHDFFESLWIVKSSLSGVLLFVPEKTEMSKKDGVFVLVLTKNYLYPSPMYFKRSFINNNAVALFYISQKSFIFLLGKEDITVVVLQNEKVVVKKYQEIIEK